MIVDGSKAASEPRFQIIALNLLILKTEQLNWCTGSQLIMTNAAFVKFNETQMLAIEHYQFIKMLSEDLF